MWTKDMRLQQRLCRLSVNYKRENAGDRFEEMINIAIIKRYGYNPYWVWKRINEEDFDYWIANCSGGPTPPPPTTMKKLLALSERELHKVISTMQGGTKRPIQLQPQTDEPDTRGTE